MRQIFFLVLLFITTGLFAQAPSNYTNINGRYRWIAGMFDSTFHIPKGTTTSLRTGGSTNAGALFYRTTDSSVYYYTGTQWLKVAGAAGFVPYTGATQNVNLGQFGLTTKFVQFDTSSQAVTDRRLQWSNAEGTLQFGMTNGATITQRIGLEQFARVRNLQGDTIEAGDVVYISGASGDRAAVKLADNRADSTSSKTLGVATEQILPNDVGLVGTFGVVGKLNLSAFTAGDVVYLDSIPGKLTKVKPQAPYHMVFVGVVERANAGNGLLFVNVQNGYELEELHNVRITSPVRNNAILAYDSVGRLWKDTTLNAIGGITGSGTSGQVSYFNGTNSITSSPTFAFTPTSQLLVNNSVTAAGAIARGGNISSTLIASANNDVLVGLDINPTFTNGAFTGVSNIGLRTPQLLLGTSLANTNTTAFPIQVNQSNPNSVIAAILRNTSSSGYASIRFYNDQNSATRALETGYSGTTYPLVLSGGISGESGYIATTGNYPLQFGTNNTYRLAITGGGNVLVNTTTDAGFRLDVNGTARVQGLITTTGGVTSTGGLLSQQTGTNSGRMTLLNLRNTGGGFLSGVGTSMAIAFTNRESGGVWSDDFIELKVYNNGVGTTTTGYNFYTHNNQAYATASVLAMSINGTNVGIGVESPAAKLEVTGSITAASAIARGVNFTNTLVAAANNDVLVGLDINPTFTNGAFTGVSNIGIRYAQGLTVFSNGQAYLGNSSGYHIRTKDGSGNNAINAYNAASANDILYLQNVSTGNLITVTGGGKLLVGTSTDAGFRLDVNGTARVQDNVTISQTTTGGVALSVTTPSGGANIMRLLRTGNIQADLTTVGSNAFQWSSSWYYTGGVTIGVAPSTAVPTASWLQVNSGISIGNTLNGWNASAILDVNSSTRGFLQPRMTTANRDAISTPATGLSVYNTSTNTNDYYNGSAWLNVGQVLVPANNTTGFSISGSSLTGSNAQSLVSLSQTWNTTGNPTAIKLDVTNTASGATADLMELQVGGVAQFIVGKSGTIQTTAPAGGTAKPWKLGNVAVVSPTSPDRTIEVEIDGVTYYIHAKTTNN